MDYVVYSTSNSDYQSWQCKLLEYTFKQVNQSGKLIRLCSFNTHEPHREFDKSEISEVIKLPDYRTRWAKESNYIDKDYGIVNKLESLKYWLLNYNELKDTDVILFLDPDMVFLKPISITTIPGKIIGQRWLDKGVEGWKPFLEYGHTLKQKLSANQVFMYPYIATVGDMKKILNRYVELTYKMRRDNYPNLWEADMFSLVLSSLEREIKVETIDNLGFCLPWAHREEYKNNEFIDEVSIIHYTGTIYDVNNDRVFNKQYYTEHTLEKNWLRINNTATTKIEKIFLKVLDNYNISKTIDFYWNDSELIDSNVGYKAEEKYLVFRPWPGGWNNIRMSLEIAACIAFLQNRILVLPPEYKMYLLDNTNSMSTFFDINDIGIKNISFENFLVSFNIKSWEDIETIAYTIDYDIVSTILTTESSVTNDILHGRSVKNINEIYDKKIVYFKDNLLGNFYLCLFTDKLPNLYKYVARHIHYKEEIFCEAYKAIEFLDKYYAIHIRRNDFQYKDLVITAEQIYNNIKDIIPEGFKLYISTDEKDKTFFNILQKHYDVYFYDDIKHLVSDTINSDIIGCIEQIICTQALTFIGCKLSTFSSYIYRLRGYMNNVYDKRFLIYQTKCEIDKEEVYWWVASWAREYSQSWQEQLNIKYFPINNNKQTNTIFVSIASYRDSQLVDTIDSLFKHKSNKNNIIIGVCMQDTQENYDNFKYKNNPNVRIHFIPYQEAKGVGYARHFIQQNLFENEDYYLQIDSHSRAIKNWDEILLSQISMCPTKKAILSTYPNAFDVADETESYFNHKTCPTLKINKIDEISKKIHCVSSGIVETNTPVLGFWCAAGFLFTNGAWAKEVEYSKDLYFTGEEDHISIMSYLNGWDVYVPPTNTIWHDYTDNRSESHKKYRPLHWEDHPSPKDNIYLLQELHNSYGKIYERTPIGFLSLAKQLSGITLEDGKIIMEVIIDFSDIPLPSNEKEISVIIFAFNNKDNEEIFRPDIYDRAVIDRKENKITYKIDQHIYDNISYCIWNYKYTDESFDMGLQLMVGKKNNKCKVWYL
jgi:hypothetical protein